MLNAQLNRTPLTRSARLSTFAALLAVTLSIGSLGAQAYGAVTGTIVDSSGGIMPNATLVLASTSSASRYEVRSNDAGVFEFVGLPAGTYRLEGTFMGFAPLGRELTIAAGETRREAVTMQVSALQETITVSGSKQGQGRTPSSVTQAVMEKASKRVCTPAATGGRIVPPMKTLDVRPAYPASLQASQTPTQVQLDALIGVDGMVKDVRAVSTVAPDVEQAASEAVRQWRFTPTLLNCVPIEVRMNVDVMFRP